MANLLRKDRRLQGKDTSRPAPSKRSPPKNTLPPPEPSEPVKPQENNSSPSQRTWLQKLLGIGK